MIGTEKAAYCIFGDRARTVLDSLLLAKKGVK
jgi:hypothetical protein